MHSSAPRPLEMADQPQEDESQDNIGTEAEISTENDAPAHFYDVPVEDESQDNAGTGAEISTDNDVPTTFTINQLSALGSVLIPADVYFRVCGGEWKLSRLNGECICLRMSRRKRIE